MSAKMGRRSDVVAKSNGRTAQSDPTDHLVPSEAITAHDVSAYRSRAFSCDPNKPITVRRRFSLREVPLFDAACSRHEPRSANIAVNGRPFLSA
jgi:hypothetical protein